MRTNRPLAPKRIGRAPFHPSRPGLATVAYLLLFTCVALAQSPWERAASNLEVSFTGPLARSLALVAIVIGGLMFMFGEGGADGDVLDVDRRWTAPALAPLRRAFDQRPLALTS